MKRIVSFLVPVIFLVLSPEIPAQAPTPDHPTRYHLIQVADATFLDKVNETAHQGYRLIAMTGAMGTLVAIMERVEESPATFTYLAVPMRTKKVETAGKIKTDLADQLNEAGAKGYRLRLTFGNLAVMESNSDPQHYQYALTSPNSLGYFKKDEISDLIDGGYHWAASTDTMFLIFEKAAESDKVHEGSHAQPPAVPYRRFSFPENNFMRRDLPEKQLHKLASEGARVVDFFGSLQQMILAMAETIPPSPPFEYVVFKPKVQSQFALHTKMSKVEAADLTRVGQQGFRLLSLSAPAPPFVMEKAPGTIKHYEYQFINAPKLSDLAEQLNDPGTNSFHVAKLAMTGDGFLVVLEKSDGE